MGSNRHILRAAARQRCSAPCENIDLHLQTCHLLQQLFLCSCTNGCRFCRNKINLQWQNCLLFVQLSQTCCKFAYMQKQLELSKLQVCSFKTVTAKLGAVSSLQGQLLCCKTASHFCSCRSKAAATNCMFTEMQKLLLQSIPLLKCKSKVAVTKCIFTEVQK